MRTAYRLNPVSMETMFGVSVKRKTLKSNPLGTN